MKPEDRAKFEALGVAGVKAKIRGGSTQIDVHHAQTWLDEKEQERLEQTLEAAKLAAQSSAKSARFAMWAAIIGVVAIVARMFWEYLAKP